MGVYDYQKAKERIMKNIERQPVLSEEEFPANNDFKDDNGFYCQVTAIFVDIRKSTRLFSSKNKEIVSKMMRSFSSEMIEILHTGSYEKHIGIRGDCVYGIYYTPNQDKVKEIFNKAIIINTLMKTLNELFQTHFNKTIEVGIGVSMSTDLIIKVGSEKIGITDKIWIGRAVTTASNLSNLGKKGKYGRIVISKELYNQIIALLEKEKGSDISSEFKKHIGPNEYTVYCSNITENIEC